MLPCQCRQVAISLFILQTVATLYVPLARSDDAASNDLEGKSSCAIYKYLGANELSVNDVVVKSSVDGSICIRARFSLAIKVEATFDDTPGDDGDTTESTPDSIPEFGGTNNGDTKRIVLGYLPLDSIVNVEDSCPDKSPSQHNDAQEYDEEYHKKSEEPDELDMIVTFECGKLAFTFKRDNEFYLASIKGVVNLDSNTIREFISDRPMCYTSDLNHYFKFNELIEVHSIAKTKAFILTANLYHSEFEAFRNTSSRAFVRCPDDNSKPYR